MENLKETLKSIKNLSESISINERYNSTDERTFWKWIDDLGQSEVVDEILDSKKSDYDKFYKSVSELGTTEEEFEKFCEIFYNKANDIREIIEEDEDAGMSDDGCEYASWYSPFCGKVKYEKALKSKDWQSVCNEYDGEHCGYAMNEDSYEEYLEENDLKPNGYAK